MYNQEIIDDAAGLTKIVEQINTVTSQCPPNFRSETNKIGSLRNTVLSRSSAERALGNFTTSKYTFHRFVTALREQLQLEIEKRTRALATSSPATPSLTFYQRYRRVPRKCLVESMIKTHWDVTGNACYKSYVVATTILCEIMNKNLQKNLRIGSYGME